MFAQAQWCVVIGGVDVIGVMRTAVVSLPDEAGVMAAVVFRATDWLTLSVLTGDLERFLPNVVFPVV